ncbi:unnamed protein product [Miscanthus lutarioriparius]|uniref:F-box domain-containing protein n=1 Tax=Miscanthus lutarioriparius TaxID=422564 RepID=A0A811RK83_9POAL|nr:unnamed protein product [Miscanthus lutarioriparius]
MEGGAPAVAHLPDELVVEILARLPAKSLCRFKCVSRSWRRLICDPAHRAKLAQTLSGFFVFPRGRRADPCPAPCHFVGLSPRGRNGGPPLVDTTLSFLPPTCGQIELLDSCNGLLLLLCWGAPPLPVHPFYVVCNPATREWVGLLCPNRARPLGRMVGAVAAVETKGQAWRVNRVRPQFHECHGSGFTGHSQGCLLYMFDDDKGDFLSVYVLEDRGSEEWTFKHNISKAGLFGPRKWQWGPYYHVVAFHPEADLIFFYDWQRNRLISYGMTDMDVHVIGTIGGEECSICTTFEMECTDHLFSLYIPLYSRILVSPIVN